MWRFVLATLLALVPISSASAQSWAQKMFSETSHNFGSVARGGLVEHQFVVRNVFGLREIARVGDCFGIEVDAYRVLIVGAEEFS